MSSQKSRLQHRQGTAAAWAAANPVLLAAEIGFESDTKILRVGDGISPFTSLTPLGTINQMGGQPVNATLSSLAALLLEANKGLYATGPETIATFDLTAAGRALLDDADATAQRATLGLGAALAAAAQPVDNANNATDGGFSTLTAPFTNGPTAGNCQMLTVPAGPNTLLQLAGIGSASADALWYRQRFAGTWREWVRVVDRLSLKSELNAPGDAPVFACRGWVNFNGTGAVSIRGSGNVSSITDNGTGIYRVNYTTPMPDANYAVVITGGNNAGTSSQFATLAGTPDANGVDIGFHLTGSGAADAANMNVAIFR